MTSRLEEYRSTVEQDEQDAELGKVVGCKRYLAFCWGTERSATPWDDFYGSYNLEDLNGVLWSISKPASPELAARYKWWQVVDVLTGKVTHTNTPHGDDK